MDIILIVAALVAIALIIFSIVYCTKKYSRPFSTTGFKVVCVLSCVLSLTANGASFLNSIMVSLNALLYKWTPTLIDSDCTEMRYVSLAAYIVLAVVWIIMFSVNLHKHGVGGIGLSFTQMLICAIVSVAVYFIVPMIAPLVLVAVAVVGGGYFLIGMLRETVNDAIHGEKKPKTLTDNYGVTVDYVFDHDDNRYYVDGRRIRDSEGRYVELRKDQNGNYVDEYGKQYR